MDQYTTETERRLRLNRLQVVETGEGLLLKRGRTIVEVQGAPSAAIAQALLQIAAEGDATRQELCAPFKPELHPAVEELIQALEARNLLTDAVGPDTAREEPVDVFYWHFGRRRQDVARNFGKVRITVLGVNCVSRRLVSALRESGVDDLEVVDYPLLANVRLFGPGGQVDEGEWPEHLFKPIPYQDWLETGSGSESGCIVGTSDFGGQHLLRSWNQHCVQERVQFLPVVLQDLIGTVGPLVVPGESACLECLRARENTHMDDPERRRAWEYGAFHGQVVNAFHPSMASILGDIAAMELIKFHGQLMRSQLVGNLIEVNLAAPEIKMRRVLKLPRCQVCSSTTVRSPISDEKVAFMPGHEAVS